MKNIKLDWPRAKLDAMIKARGPIKGVVAVVVSSRLGDEYATMMTGKNADLVLAELPPSAGIYAVMPSCDPNAIKKEILSLWDDDALKVAPYTVEDDGVVYHKGLPDQWLHDMRRFALHLFAEQHPVEFIEEWGTASATA